MWFTAYWEEFHKVEDYSIFISLCNEYSLALTFLSPLALLPAYMVSSFQALIVRGCVCVCICRIIAAFLSVHWYLIWTYALLCGVNKIIHWFLEKETFVSLTCGWQTSAHLPPPPTPPIKMLIPGPWNLVSISHGREDFADEGHGA